jgi:hypothetical protein
MWSFLATANGGPEWAVRIVLCLGNAIIRPQLRRRVNPQNAAVPLYFGSLRTHTVRLTELPLLQHKTKPPRWGGFFMSEDEMITAEKLRRLLTGHFRWRVRRSNRIRVGDIAGDANHVGGARRIGIFGRSYLAHHLAVLHVTGKFPVHRVAFRNGLRSDSRWRNLKVA